MTWITDNRLFSVSPKRTCRIFCKQEPVTGRKCWFFVFAGKLAGPFDSLAEADEELFEALVARNRAPQKSATGMTAPQSLDTPPTSAFSSPR